MIDRVEGCYGVSWGTLKVCQVIGFEKVRSIPPFDIIIVS